MRKTTSASAALPAAVGDDARAPASAARRVWLREAVALGAGTLLLTARPSSLAAEGDLAAAIRAFTGGATPIEGRIHLEIAPLVENGNAVPITVDVDTLMTPTDHVKSIAVFNERNPQRDVVVFTLGPRCGRGRVATRIRLATSQKLVALARMNDGSYRQHTVDVIVTLAACVES
jgi:sulfur-oxidizing protein SoxY